MPTGCPIYLQPQVNEQSTIVVGDVGSCRSKVSSRGVFTDGIGRFIQFDPHAFFTCKVRHKQKENDVHSRIEHGRTPVPASHRAPDCVHEASALRTHIARTPSRHHSPARGHTLLSTKETRGETRLYRDGGLSLYFE